MPSARLALTDALTHLADQAAPWAQGVDGATMYS
jgi:hypothetical protein